MWGGRSSGMGLLLSVVFFDKSSIIVKYGTGF